MKPIWVLVAAIVASPAVADTLTEAVGYGITGRDGAQVRTVDRRNCIFAVGNQTFYLNNVQTDRLKVETWSKSTPRGDVFDHYTVAMHGGDAKVFEEVTIVEPAREETMPPELARELKRMDTDAFKRKTLHSTLNEAHLPIANTADIERVTRAWSYVYANGCTGKNSPF